MRVEFVAGVAVWHCVWNVVCRYGMSVEYVAGVALSVECVAGVAVWL